MSKIVTFGEILLRLSTPAGERLRRPDGQLSIHYGGSEANVAVALAQFGHPVEFITKVPDNALGAAAMQHLRRFGVSVDHTVNGGERLGMYYLETGIAARGAQVVYDRKYSSFSGMQRDEIDFDSVFEKATLFHISGITPALSENLQEVQLYAVKKAKEYNLIVSFDCNYRSKLWDCQQAAVAFRRLFPYVDVVFCGELDAIDFFGIEKINADWPRHEKLEYYYKKISQIYPDIQYMASTFRDIHTVSSHSLQGNYFVDGHLFQSPDFLINPIVDRVGGGDTFAAGILYGILNGMPGDTVVSFATAASVLKHTVHGDCNFFTAQEVAEFLGNQSGKIKR